MTLGTQKIFKGDAETAKVPEEPRNWVITPTFRHWVSFQDIPQILHRERTQTFEADYRYRILETAFITCLLYGDPMLARSQYNLKITPL